MYKEDLIHRINLAIETKNTLITIWKTDSSIFHIALDKEDLINMKNRILKKFDDKLNKYGKYQIIDAYIRAYEDRICNKMQAIKREIDNMQGKDLVLFYLEIDKSTKVEKIWSYKTSELDFLKAKLEDYNENLESDYYYIEAFWTTYLY